eukprot:705820-Prorocentrum_minimum.AAC.4
MQRIARIRMGQPWFLGFSGFQGFRIVRAMLRLWGFQASTTEASVDRATWGSRLVRRDTTIHGNRVGSVGKFGCRVTVKGNNEP